MVGGGTHQRHIGGGLCRQNDVKRKKERKNGTQVYTIIVFAVAAGTDTTVASFK